MTKMQKLRICIFAFVLAYPSVSYSQTEVEREAVRQAVLDYVEGVYEVAPERIQRSVHPDLVKRGFYMKKGENTYTFSPMTFPELVNLARTYNKDGRIPKDAPKEIVVYDVLDQTAIAKLIAAWGVDYFQLAKYKGKWMIVNILWQSPPPPTARTAKYNQTVHREVAVTFDDLPATYGNGDLERLKSVTKRLLQSIKANGVPAVGFVNESKLHRNGQVKERTALLHMWLDNGLELGNHTFSHIAIDQVPLTDYKEDVIRGERVIRMLLAEKDMKLRYFRHTQLRTGPTPEYKRGLEEFLIGRGYTIAPVTIDNNDFMFAAIYGDAKMRGDAETMRRVVDAYIPYMESVFDFFEKLSVDFLGYEIKQTLLLHANDLNADHFDGLANMMKKRGYTFITLEQALQDKAYKLPDAQVTKGLSWIHRWMIAKGMQMRPEPSEPKLITEMFQARQTSLR
jgi:peptidoglycan/xylan/chitin deacetylase (PgdA/CDA1 family)